MGIERVSLLFKDCVCLIFCASLQFLGAKAPLYLATLIHSFSHLPKSLKFVLTCYLMPS